MWSFALCGAVNGLLMQTPQTLAADRRPSSAGAWRMKAGFHGNDGIQLKGPLVPKQPETRNKETPNYLSFGFELSFRCRRIIRERSSSSPPGQSDVYDDQQSAEDGQAALRIKHWRGHLKNSLSKVEFGGCSPVLGEDTNCFDSVHQANSEQRPLASVHHRGIGSEESARSGALAAAELPWQPLHSQKAAAAFSPSERACAEKNDSISNPNDGLRTNRPVSGGGAWRRSDNIAWETQQCLRRLLRSEITACHQSAGVIWLRMGPCNSIHL
ncbi:uncharacterized protein LOC122356780 [Puntigrus tetrazona]|uniref:uncharacterized protein LOC122356780 n=1 Tax=Puntigrus tetrazona TaxID=1606681 RepID=UPI001C890A76|nr:uncharacterized protein LOC122356780 [Puntigrus tetrazona]XP_043111769.1 uncharacterized protein LOC122356780 [Puntigrus tetrazona]XP_043111772.1 uncharacterized protein LOC122356780 [Puntigrus tetrazona]XP_043111773.1 uncharacterized protein LOC122356780 [Puntigrus tetrazona]XP_043111774.1 uncharacterized protein LOC122356780 [Puntigrus tetrazona]